MQFDAIGRLKDHRPHPRSLRHPVVVLPFIDRRLF
jgi:hypothetical protein